MNERHSMKELLDQSSFGIPDVDDGTPDEVIDHLMALVTKPPATNPSPRQEARTKVTPKLVESKLDAAAKRTSGQPMVVSPTEFGDVQQIADMFKAGHSVAINLGDAEPGARRRLLDFCSGLCFALNGRMDRVAPLLYLLTPATATATATATNEVASPLGHQAVQTEAVDLPEPSPEPEEVLADRGARIV